LDIGSYWFVEESGEGTSADGIGEVTRGA